MRVAIVSGVYNIELTMRVDCREFIDGRLYPCCKLYDELKERLSVSDGWLDDATAASINLNTHQLDGLRSLSIGSDFVIIDEREYMKEAGKIDDMDQTYGMLLFSTRIGEESRSKALQKCIDKAHAEKLKAKHGIATPQRRRSGL